MTADPPSPHAIAPPVTTVDDEGRHVLAVDVPCIQCGYNMRGLDRETVCPECGGAVERSLHGRQLRFAEPRWLSRLRVGTLLWILGSLLTFGRLVCSYLGAWLLSPASAYWEYAPLLYYSRLVLAVVAVALVTTREPATSVIAEGWTSRRVLRLLGILLLLLPALSWVSAKTFGTVGNIVASNIASVSWLAVQCSLLLLLRSIF